MTKQVAKLVNGGGSHVYFCMTMKSHGMAFTPEFKFMKVSLGNLV
jgi:hypothetical protein